MKSVSLGFSNPDYSTAILYHYSIITIFHFKTPDLPFPFPRMIEKRNEELFWKSDHEYNEQMNGLLWCRVGGDVKD